MDFLFILRALLLEDSEEENAANNTGPFGGALTAALDVMAFTHDIDLNIGQTPVTVPGLGGKISFHFLFDFISFLGIITS